MPVSPPERYVTVRTRASPETGCAVDATFEGFLPQDMNDSIAENFPPYLIAELWW